MNIEDEILGNPILRNVQAKFQNQQVKGLAKYGETVNPKSYDIVGWLNHLQQELIDGTVYAEVLIGEMSQIVEENKKLREALEDIAARWQDVDEPQLTHLGMWNRAKEALEELNNGLR